MSEKSRGQVKVLVDSFSNGQCPVQKVVPGAPGVSTARLWPRMSQWDVYCGGTRCENGQKVDNEISDGFGLSTVRRCL